MSWLRIISHALAHHAKALEPLVGVLAIGIMLRLQPLGWRLVQSGVGGNSFSLQRGLSDPQFHLRYSKSGSGKGIDQLRVKDSWFGGKWVGDPMRTRLDVLRFIEGVESL